MFRFVFRLPGIWCCREVNCCEHRFPKRVTYSLTATGRKLAAIVEQFRDVDEERLLDERPNQMINQLAGFQTATFHKLSRLRQISWNRILLRDALSIQEPRFSRARFSGSTQTESISTWCGLAGLPRSLR